ncbi:MAG TPA: hypothetical protein VMS56_12010 [Thermoanaerobaculia bacterium]|nr:hypothetical protein [Thermoanaerobaculia bacterium]
MNRAGMRAAAALAASALSLLLTVACGELELITAPPEPEPPPDPSATFTRVQTEIFTPTCTVIGCHDTFGQSEGLVLVAGQAYANLVNRPSTQMPALDRIEPGDPDRSYLYRKITGTAGTGERMPAFSPPLPPEQIALIRDWIRRGAPND